MPADVHIVTETANRQPANAPNWLDSSAYDWLARVTLVLVFTFLLFVQVTGALRIATDWQHQPLGELLLRMLPRVSTGLFLALVAATAITRLRPLRKAAGIEPRL